MKYSDDILKNEKIWILIWKMAVPCVLAQVVNLLYNIVDRIYIGNMEVIGKTALAGLGLCIPIITLISAFASFVAGGGAPLASRYLGQGDREKAHRVLGNGAVLLIIFSTVLMIVAFIFKKPLLYAIGASEDTFSYADEYMSIYLIGTYFVQIAFGLNTFITAQGKSKLAMTSTLIGAILNIGLDPLFIFAFNMGIKGAALATVISQGVSSIFVLLVLTNKKASLRLELKYMKLDWGVIGNIFALGIAPFVMAATESVIGFALNGQLKKYGGDDHVSNLAILSSCMMLISVPLTGITQGVTPILSYNFGAKDKDRLKECYKKVLLMCVAYATTFAIVMMIFPRLFAQMFTQDEEIINLTIKYLPIFVSGMLIFGAQRACQTTFVSIGEAVISLFIAMLRKIILLVPFTFIFPLFLGVTGVYVAECVADFMSATICFTIFIFRFRKVLKRMDEGKKELDLNSQN